MICAVCGTSFTASRLSARYCSTKCKKKAERNRAKKDGQRTVTKAQAVTSCAHCGQVFVFRSPRARYCQNSCRQSAYRERKKITTK